MNVFYFIISSIILLAASGGVGAMIKNADKKNAQAQEISAENAVQQSEEQSESGAVEKKSKNPKNITVSNGKLLLDISAKDGSTGIFAINKKGKKEGLFSNTDGYANSYFVLKAGKRQILLRGSRSGKAECSVQETENGAQVFYDIEDTAQVAIDYTFMPKEASMYVTVFITNTGKSGRNYALKAIYDTFLGELSSTAFTFNGEPIQSRRKITEFSNGDWIISANRRTSVAFVLPHLEQYTGLESLSVGTPEDFSSSKWQSDIAEDRLFASVHSFNDSALAFNWNEVFLAPNETAVQSFVISAGTQGAEPDYIATAEKIRRESEQGAGAENGQNAKSAMSAENAPEQIVEERDEQSKSETPAVIAIPVVTESSEPSKPVREVSDWQLDPVYIQSLLDRISELQADGSVDKNEIRQLSEELDAIYSKLRQKN